MSYCLVSLRFKDLFVRVVVSPFHNLSTEPVILRGKSFFMSSRALGQGFLFSFRLQFIELQTLRFKV